MEEKTKSRHRGWIGFLIFFIIVCLVGGGIFIAIQMNRNNDNSSSSQSQTSSNSSQVQYSVTFDMNGYRTLDNITDYIDANSVVTAPDINRPGYNLIWTIDKSGETVWNFLDPITNNLTLYAQWSLISYTVNFDISGGIGTVPTSQQTHTLTYQDLNGITSKLQEPNVTSISKEGYVFGGWWLKDDLGNMLREWNFSTDLVTNDMTLYIGWALSNTVGHYTIYEYDNAVKIIDYDNALVDGTLTIPSEISNKKVLSIGKDAFRNFVDADNVVLPSYLTTICESAFYGSLAVYQLTIPNSVTSIGKMAFHSCSNLYDLNLGTGVINIGEMGFYQCTSLGCFSKVTIPSNVRSIEDDAFNISAVNKPLNNIEFKEGLEYIGQESFSHISASSIALPDSLQYISRDAFKYTYCLGEIHIGKGIQVIGYDAFRYAQKENVIGYLHVYVNSIVPPELVNAVAFGDFTITNGTPSRQSFWIVVLDQSLEAYKTAPNWSTYYSTRIVTFLLS